MYRKYKLLRVLLKIREARSYPTIFDHVQLGGAQQSFAIICPVTIGCTASYFRMSSQSSGRLNRALTDGREDEEENEAMDQGDWKGLRRVIACKDASHASAQQYSVLQKMEVLRVGRRQASASKANLISKCGEKEQRARENKISKFEMNIKM